MRKLRVENSLYSLPDEVWREINDLLGPYAEEAIRLVEDVSDSPAVETAEDVNTADQVEPPAQPEASEGEVAGEQEH